jgi:hypothetical protein
MRSSSGRAGCSRSSDAEDQRLRAICDALATERRIVATSDARRAELLAEAADIAHARTERLADVRARVREMPLRSLAAELAVALRLSDSAVQQRLSDASALMAGRGVFVADLDDGMAELILRTGWGARGKERRARRDPRTGAGDAAGHRADRGGR